MVHRDEKEKSLVAGSVAPREGLRKFRAFCIYDVAVSASGERLE